jgi:hypothetical protein
MDDTIPQSNEGTELLTLAITPKSAANILEIEAIVPCSFNASFTLAVAALFQDSTANGLAVTWESVSTSDAYKQLHLRFRMVADTTSATTFKLRVGVSGGALTINGAAGARVFGGLMAARMFIKEITA